MQRLPTIVRPIEYKGSSAGGHRAVSYRGGFHAPGSEWQTTTLSLAVTPLRLDSCFSILDVRIGSPSMKSGLGVSMVGGEVSDQHWRDQDTLDTPKLTAMMGDP